MHAIAIAISLWAHPAVPLPPPFCCCCDPLLLLSFSLFVSVFLVACEPKKERETRRMTAKGKKKTLTSRKNMKKERKMEEKMQKSQGNV